MVEWHHRLDGHGFGWTPGVGDGQGGLSAAALMSAADPLMGSQRVGQD